MNTREHNFIKDFREGDKIKSIYLLRAKTCGNTKKGDFYISLELIDSSGRVDAKVWDANEELYKKLDIDSFVEVEGRIDFFKGLPQIKISIIRVLNKDEEQFIQMELFLPQSPKALEEMFNELMATINEIKNPFLKDLCIKIFSDEVLMEKFKRCPAATDFHHPYIGGLLEHTLNLSKLAKLIIKNYPNTINEELLIVGCLMHDLGKIEEITCRRSFNYSDKGKFLGHIVIGTGIVNRKIQEIADFPENLSNLILHLILSHHGEYEWGSPKRPKCLEAVILHYLDNLDAKINGFHWFIENHNTDKDSSWTNYSKMFDEYLFKDSKLLESE